MLRVPLSYKASRVSNFAAGFNCSRAGRDNPRGDTRFGRDREAPPRLQGAGNDAQEEREEGSR